MLKQENKPIMQGYAIVGVVFGVVFIALKLTGSIGWSWWAVTAPFLMVVIRFPILLGLQAMDKQNTRLWQNNFRMIQVVILGVVFIALKLTGIIGNWSWWAVTAPLWIAGLAYATFAFIIPKCRKKV